MEVSMKQSRGPLPISVIIVCGFLLMAIVSIAYSLYDLIFPDHFVDSRYGLEIQMRLFWLGIVTDNVQYCSHFEKDTRVALRLVDIGNSRVFQERSNERSYP